jgi:hypothetical protein
MRPESPLQNLNEYEIRHLCTHLLEAGQHEALHRLLELEDSEHRNAWYEAKDAIQEVNGYSADIARVWEAVERDSLSRLERGEQSPGVALEVRYALISATLASMVGQAAGAAGAFVRHGFWTPEEAVAQTSLIPDWDAQLRSYVSLAQTLEGENRRTCERSAIALIAEGPVNFSTRTVASVSKDEEISTNDHQLRAQCLETLTRTLHERLVQDALAAGLKIENWYWRIHALKTVVPRLEPEKRREVVAQMRAVAGQLQFRFLRAEAQAIVAALSEEPERARLIAEAFEESLSALDDFEARRILNQEPASGMIMILHWLQRLQHYLRPLREVAPHLGLAQLRSGLESARALSAEAGHDARLVLLPRLAEAGDGAASLRMAEGIEHPVYKNLTLIALSPFLTPEQEVAVTSRVLRDVESMEDAESRVYCMAWLAERMRPAALSPVLRQINADLPSVENTSLQAEVIANVGRALERYEGGDKQSIARNSYEVIKGFDRQRWNALIEPLVPALDGETVRTLFEDARRLDFGKRKRQLLEEWGRADDKTLPIHARVSTSLPDDVLAEVAESAGKLQEYQGSRLLVLLAPLLRKHQLERALAVAREMDSDYLRALALAALTMQSGESSRPALALETLRTVWAVDGGIDGAQPLLRRLLSLAVPDLRVAVHAAWAQFLHSLSRDSIHTLLQYLSPSRPAVESLGGDASGEGVLQAIDAVERWWGEEDSDDQGEEAKETDARAARFDTKPIPETEPEIILNLIFLLTEGRQLECATNLLIAFRAGSDKDYARARYVERAEDTLIAGLSGAGRFGEAVKLLESVEQPSERSLNLLVSTLISHGRLEQARAVYDRVSTVFGEAVAAPLGKELIESYVAEEQLSNASSVFENLNGFGDSEAAAYAFADAAFVLINAYVRQGEWEAVDRVGRALVTITSRTKFAHSVAARLADYASRLNMRDDKERARLWYSIASSILAK